MKGRRGAPARAEGPVLVVHPSADLYGSDRMLVEAVRELVAVHGDVVVAVPRTGRLVPVLLGTGARVEEVPTLVLGKRLLNPRGLPALLREAVTGVVVAARTLHRLRPRAVYINTLTLPLWPLLARWAGARVVVHVHEAEQEMPAPVRGALALPLLPAHRVLVNSEFSRSVLVGSVPRLAGRSSVLLNGVAGPPGGPRPARHDLGGQLRILYVGRLSERKGVHLLVDVVRHLEERGVHAVLDVVGDTYPGYDWFEEFLRCSAETAAVAHRVRFHGFHVDVWPWLAAADVAVVPSVKAEPFGNTAVEAVLAARPVVVADHSGLCEAVRGCRGAQRVDVRRPDAPALLADALLRVRDDWAGFRAAAAADAPVALARHDPSLFGRRVAEVVTAVRRERPGPASRPVTTARRALGDLFWKERRA